MAVVASVLCAILLMEMTCLPASADNAQKVAAGEIMPIVLQPLPVPVLSKTLSASILERPLFAPSRRAPVSVSFVAPLPRLSGVIVTAHTREAIFVSGDGSQLALAQGGHLDNYVLKEVGLASVTLMNPTDNSSLKLQISATTEISTNTDHAASFVLIQKPIWLHENLEELADEKFRTSSSLMSFPPVTSLLPDNSSTLGLLPGGMTN